MFGVACLGWAYVFVMVFCGGLWWWSLVVDSAGGPLCWTLVVGLCGGPWVLFICELWLWTLVVDFGSELLVVRRVPGARRNFFFAGTHPDAKGHL